MTLDRWVDEQQAHGKYAFLRADAIRNSGLSPDAVRKALQRLVRRRRLLKLKDYFYVIIPLEYANAGGPPAPWFVDPLMAAMRLPYYVGLLTAAGLHGASLHQPQEFQVVTSRSVRPILAGRVRLRFFVSKFIERASTVSVKTATGSMRVSTPETTAVDLVRFARSAGHLDHVAGVLAGLSTTLDARKLLAAVRTGSDVPTAQRLGYVLDRVGAGRLAQPIHAWLAHQAHRPVPLRGGGTRLGAREDRRWRVLVQEPLEVEH